MPSISHHRRAALHVVRSGGGFLPQPPQTIPNSNKPESVCERESVCVCVCVCVKEQDKMHLLKGIEDVVEHAAQGAVHGAFEGLVHGGLHGIVPGAIQGAEHGALEGVIDAHQHHYW